MVTEGGLGGAAAVRRRRAQTKGQRDERIVDGKKDENRLLSIEPRPGAMSPRPGA
ncbi:hypothetical protein PIB30_043307 [Stylosanthes scabra]|uniref:Uncharacterized protein n=1 Tax=Stylosanthes scabra TaxID=79078 RepID=A0ABU6ZE87_9FABA|nr:hypothetical protein [Stylosanthes scabra]